MSYASFRCVTKSVTHCFWFICLVY